MVTTGIILTLLLTLTTALTGAHDEDPITSNDVSYDEKKVHFVSGTYAETVGGGDDEGGGGGGSIFYDSYLPLIFQFQVPKHMDNAMKIMWSHATVCNASDSRYDGKLCPVVHHLHKVVANLSAEMGFWKDFLPPPVQQQQVPHLDTSSDHHSTTIKPVSKPTTMTMESFWRISCAEIGPHFGSKFVLSQAQVDNYLKALSRCALLSKSPTLTPITLPVGGNWIIDKQIYYTMVDRFYTEFYRTLPGTGNIDWVVTLNSYVSIQSLLLSNNYMESNKVLTAFIQCQQGLLPDTFVRVGLLRDAMRKRMKDSNLKMSHLSPVWDPEGDGIQAYYKFPLAECAFTEEYNLIVKLLVPLKGAEVESRSLIVKSFPFVQKFPDSGKVNLCRVQVPPIRLVQSNSGLLFEDALSSCGNNKLCLRSKLSSYSPPDACGAAVVANNESLIKESCPIACFPVGDEKSLLPIFQRVANGGDGGNDDEGFSGTFIAVGTSDHKIFIQCNGQPLEKIGLPNVGAMEIKLSCNCQISYRNLLLQPLHLCSSSTSTEKVKVRVRHILPLHWQSLVPPSRFGDIDEVVLLHKLETEEKTSYFHYNTTSVDHDHPASSSGMYVSPSEEEVLSAGVVVQMALLWMAVLVLFASNLTLLYHVFFLVKWKKLQHYKDTRIVYNVPPSPQIVHSSGSSSSHKY